MVFPFKIITMRAHPIPQNVVSFEDRIFGPLTAKQFSIIATGLSFAFVLYMSPLPENFKFPVVGVVSLFSFAAGLLKINDMSLDVWLTTFIGAIYSPTQFIWQKTTEEFVSFLQITHKQLTNSKLKDSQEKTEKIRKDLYPGLFTVEQQDEKEQEFLSQLNFEVPTPHTVSLLTEEKVSTLNIPIETTQPKEVIQKTAIPAQQPTIQGTPQILSINKESVIIPQKPKEIKPKVEVYPERKNTPSTSKVKGVTPLASEINFTNKPVFTLRISGQEPQYVQGLSNLKVNKRRKTF